MSLEFDGVDDYLTANAFGAVTLGDQLALAVWFNADTLGELGQGALVWHQATSAALTVMFDVTPNTLSLYHGWTTGFVLWTMTTPFTTLPGWKWVGINWDRSGTATWRVYDGLTYATLTEGAGLTRVDTHGGTSHPDGGSFVLGNSYNGDQTWDGKLAEFAHWRRGLSEAEFRAVFELGVLAVPDPYLYLPGDDAGLQNLGPLSRSEGLTFGGAGYGVQRENPPIRPAGRRG